MIQKRFSIGKEFRNLKKLRMKDPLAEVPETPEALKEYIAHLVKNGVQINKVKYALFQTKNGLKYPGLIATDRIVSNEDLVLVPRDLLLTTRHAFQSPLQEMFQAYPQFFSNYFTSSWEDHMLLAFLLYEYQRGQESPWFWLIQNLPREIDYLVFWEKEDQELLQDEVLVKQARKQFEEFVTEFETLQMITQKFKCFYKEGTVTFENAKWIYTHLVTRCFGKYLNYVTMVPFCELFNHECVDVYYDFQYKADNPNKTDEFDDSPPQALSEDDILSQSSSDGSYNSDDEISDSEFVDELYQQQEFDFDEHQELQKGEFYDKFKTTFNIDHVENESEEEYNERIKVLQDQQIKMRKEFNIKQNLQREIYLLSKDIKMWMFSNLDFGDNYTIFFVGQMYSKLNKSLQEYILGNKAYFMAREDMKRVQLTCSTYRNNLYNYFKDTLKKTITSTYNFAQKKTRKEDEKMTSEQILAQNVEADVNYYNSEWNPDKFDTFVMKCSRKDQFEKGSQVYFCYGRLSNRMMLIRYGMALEHNKYDHYHFRLNYMEYLTNKDSLALVYKYKLSNLKRFKLKFTSFPTDLIVFCKATLWKFNVHSLESFFSIQDLKLEQSGLLMALDLLVNRLMQLGDVNEEQLLDKKLGYHEHFALIYRLERVRILKFNINLIKICLKVVERMLSGIDFSIAILRIHDMESQSQYGTNRILLKKYFDNLKHALYIPK